MRFSSIPARARSTTPPRHDDFGARTPGYVKQPAEWSVSNELIGSAGIISLSCVTLFGAIGVLIFIATTALLIVQNPKRNLASLIYFSPLLAIPVLAILSSFWSVSPAATMRGGQQLMLTCVAAIVIARNVRPERTLLVLFIGFAAICISVLPGIPASIASGAPLSSAILGSKNQVGYSAYMLATVSIAIVIDKAQPLAARLASILAIPVAIGMLLLAQSGGGTSSLMIALIVVPCLAALGWFNFGGRVAILLFMIGVLVIALVFMTDIEAALVTFRTETLQKDATLTGRTYLWEFAERLSEKRPWLGNGYGAFWQQGNIDAEGLWRWGGIANRSGFNFHNAFVGMKVDLGIVGEGLLFATCAVIGVAGLMRQFARPTPAMACLLGMMIVAYARSYVEDGLMAPFNIATVIWLATFIYSIAPGIKQFRTGLYVDRARVS